MSFFKKLKERMFKSSSKLDEGLDAIVEDGAGVEPVDEVMDEVAGALAEAPAETAQPVSDDPVRPERAAPRPEADSRPDPVPEVVRAPEPGPET
ncbi:signal recognition particle-docking protein FtsY, partial [Rhodobacterales bacterium HKCCE2091]|nr:signal recognition particle-docking protein FtsY [Rhodobacterales bacterium HKCCE2091]